MQPAGTVMMDNGMQRLLETGDIFLARQASRWTDPSVLEWLRGRGWTGRIPVDRKRLEV
jgi:hypothetical protein